MAALHCPPLQNFLPSHHSRNGRQSQPRQPLKITGVKCQQRIPMFNRLCRYPQVVVAGPGRPAGLLDRSGEHDKGGGELLAPSPLHNQLLFLYQNAAPVDFLLAMLHQQFQQLLADQNAGPIRIHGVFNAASAQVHQGIGVG